MLDPYLLPGGSRGCLIIHGFSGDPGEMLPLGRALAARGLTVLGLTLPGHTGRPSDLALVRWQDWQQAVLDGYDALTGRCADVAVAGFSLGGALAALLAAQRPVRRLAMLSTPNRLAGDWRVGLIGGMRHLGLWYHPYAHADFRSPDVRDALHRRLAPDLSLDDPAVQAQIRREARVAFSALDELRQALSAARRILPQVTAPAFVQHGRLDTIVEPVSAQQIMAELGSPRRELLYWEHSGHFLLDGVDGLQVIQRTMQFLTEADDAIGNSGG